MLDRLVSVLVDRTGRQYLFTLLAYVTGLLGVVLVFVHELWLDLPEGMAVTASILLMGVSFLSLLAATISGPVAPGR